MFFKRQPKVRTFLGESVFWIEANKIRSNPQQARHDFDDASLKELMQSIEEKGILQPLIVSRIETEPGFGFGSHYELIAGERRWRAAKLLGMKEVPVIIVRSPQSDQEKLELSLVENVQREDLNPIERAKAFERLQREFGLSQNDIAKKIGKSREVVANTMRLLNLEPNIQEVILAGEITEGHGRALLAIPGLAERFAALQEIKEKQLSVREAESLAQALKRSPHATSSSSEDLRSYKEALSEALGVKVSLQKTTRGGKITIQFFSQDELEKLVQKLKGD